ncbi:MAG: zinc-dependent alcohol dehydrogenase family protein [Planctomycetaceae bacterium]|nr:zinc-dependent alcohol dehydrogenase family protein [Planctomycetaceae bacterium]
MTMKAIQYEQFGEPSQVLQMAEKEIPEPGPGEVRVKMLVSPINPSDLMSIRGGYTYTPELPATPGFEGVGIVESSGGGMLGKMMIGKRVAVLNRNHGNWCEQTVTSAKQVIPVPKQLHDDQAASFFVNPATAFILTTKVLQVPKDGWLVQTAANSSLGKMVIKLGLMNEFKTLNIVRREEEKEKLKFLGATRVIVFDIERDPPEKLVEQIVEITGGGARYVMDPVGGRLASILVDALGKDAQMVLYGTMSGENVSFFPRSLMSINARIRGFHLGGWMENQSIWAKMSLIRQISRLVVDGTLSTDSAKEYPLTEFVEAIEKSQQPGMNTKVLLRIAEGEEN